MNQSSDPSQSPSESQSRPVVRLLIHGASGRMGQALLRLAGEREDIAVVAAVARSTPAQRVVDGVPHFSAAELVSVPEFDVAIDFSLPQGMAPLLALCEARGCGLISGTTGLEPEQHAALDAAAARIPVLWASNFSLGVAVLDDLVRRAAAALPGWDCDIVESHHVHKKDAPSGTALTLGEAARAGGAEPRYAALRAGDIVGEHMVQFTGLGERIELAHRATSRDIFARGALHVAARLRDRPAGRYRVADLLS
ncbi:4-hydroxy-tetrahydrodipicolinate reductase [Marilutibacter maris]|nr:4-hydroxy-tetrahydrodipicolinate reductase [Lysobacter maris]